MVKHYNRSYMKTLKSHILAWLALAVFCAVVSCKRKEPVKYEPIVMYGVTVPKNVNILIFPDSGLYSESTCCDTVIHGDTVYMNLLDTTDNDWIKGHSEIKKLEN